MPYIVNDRRATSRTHPATAGELNYAFTELMLYYTRFKGLNYQTINDIIGAAEGAKAEFQRRVVAPYEDEKIRMNGDVYPTAVGIQGETK